jgi:hypothetical protein
VAFLRGETSATPDVELFKALEPATATLSSSMIIGISFFALEEIGIVVRQVQKTLRPGFGRRVSHPRPDENLEPNPHGLIDRAIAEDAAGAMAEWMAEWRSDAPGSRSAKPRAPR